jgi:hypothetical protein
LIRLHSVDGSRNLGVATGYCGLVMDGEAGHGADHFLGPGVVRPPYRAGSLWTRRAGVQPEFPEFLSQNFRKPEL